MNTLYNIFAIIDNNLIIAYLLDCSGPTTLFFITIKLAEPQSFLGQYVLCQISFAEFSALSNHKNIVSNQTIE